MERYNCALIQGGPGFKVSYFKDSFDKSQYNLFFADKLGENERCLKDYTDNAVFFLNMLPDDVDNLICHSFGCLVLASCFNQLNKIFKNIVFVNPVPLNSENYMAMVMHQMSMLDVVTKAKVLTGNFCFEDISHLYFYKPELASKFHIDICYETYFSVAQSFAQFDFSTFLSADLRLHVIRGKHDFVNETHIEPILQIAKNNFNIDKAAHFPFFENRPAFHDALFQALK